MRRCPPVIADDHRSLCARHPRHRRHGQSRMRRDPHPPLGHSHTHSDTPDITADGDFSLCSTLSPLHSLALLVVLSPLLVQSRFPSGSFQVRAAAKEGDKLKACKQRHPQVSGRIHISSALHLTSDAALTRTPLPLLVSWRWWSWTMRSRAVTRLRCAECRRCSSSPATQWTCWCTASCSPTHARLRESSTWWSANPQHQRPHSASKSSAPALTTTTEDS